MPLYNNITETVGRTPMVKLNRITEGLPGTVAVKMESRNPLASVKDRIGVAMIEDAEKKGLIKSYMGGTTAERGGRRKRIFQATDAGMKVIAEIKASRQKLWNSRLKGFRTWNTEIESLMPGSPHYSGLNLIFLKNGFCQEKEIHSQKRTPSRPPASLI